MRHRTKRKLVDAGKGAAVLIGAIAWLAYAMHWFEIQDCRTAQRGLAYIERCAADSDCELTKKDYYSERVWRDMEHEFCTKD